ncbi:MAG: ATP-binding cassette domain-containing protein [Magnetococcales bacterium]|nr:ATP-binding cassette domain-containing protein [Magnetococcales bacterium]
MALITLHEISISFGSAPLLQGANLVIEPDERLCLVGRNGVGKTTLLKLLAGEIQPDNGTVSLKKGLRVARLGQEISHDQGGTVFEVVSEGVGEKGALLRRYHETTLKLADRFDDAGMAALEKLQHELDAQGAWDLHQGIESVISHLKLDGEMPFQDQSGGQKRRTMLAQALVGKPDMLLLDEPTNHLDVETIDWLEGFLKNFRGCLLFITHDREFIRRLASRIIEVDRGRLTSWPGNYDLYLTRKQEALSAEAGQAAKFDKKLAQEEVWIRQGIQARRTRNQGRVRELHRLRQVRQERREKLGQVRMELSRAQRSGKLVVEAEKVQYSWDGTPFIQDFSTIILRGDRIGIIGPNGSGKTTLLQLLLGQIQPTAGSMQRGTRLEVAYFDQHRAELDLEKTVEESVAGGRKMITFNDRETHVISYLQDFLFTPDRARSPVKVLSGGERNRLLLARLFLKPANLMVLDEPTNDLDVETLELLEALLMGYQGTLLVVSHDRAFINNVVTSTLVFEGNHRIGEYPGGYDDWLKQRTPPPSEVAADAKKAKKPTAKPRKAASGLTYKERLELEALPGQIENLEATHEKLNAQLADPEFYQSERDRVAEVQGELEGVEGELEAAYAQWEALEAKSKGAGS